jgi:SNF2 family DNA or RNA helicase
MKSRYVFKTKPYKHQSRCFNRFKDSDVGALFLEMALGKTKIIIDIICHKWLNKQIKSVLYICPNSVVDNMVKEFNLHASVPINIIKVEGTNAKRRSLILSHSSCKKDTCSVWIINYEALRLLKDVLCEAHFDMIVADESTRIKNFKAKCSRVAHLLAATTKYRFILTGTPITQSAIDIYSQYKFLDSTIFGDSYWAFRGQYAIMGGYKNKIITGYRDLNVLQAKVFTVAERYTKKQCLDIPDKVYTTRTFELNKEERKAYDSIKANVLTELKKGTVNAGLAIVKMTKLIEVVSGFVKDENGKVIEFKNSSKLALLQEVIEDILPNKIIIWCNHLANIERIDKLLTSTKVKHVTFSGQVDPKARQALIDQFNDDTDTKIFIGQIQTGGIGINLGAATYEIFYTNSFSLQNRLQAEDRADGLRRRKGASLTIIDLVGANTIDVSMTKALSGKLNLARAVIDKTREFIDGTI